MGLAESVVKMNMAFSAVKHAVMFCINALGMADKILLSNSMHSIAHCQAQGTLVQFRGHLCVIWLSLIAIEISVRSR